MGACPLGSARLTLMAEADGPRCKGKVRLPSTLAAVPLPELLDTNAGRLSNSVALAASSAWCMRMLFSADGPRRAGLVPVTTAVFARQPRKQLLLCKCALSSLWSLVRAWWDHSQTIRVA
jgi:hypothetical protein